MLAIPDRDKMGAALAECPAVRLAVLFGSAARDRMRAESDVDVGVLLQPFAASGRYRLLKDLIRILARFFPAHLLDVVLLNDGGDLLKFEAAKTGIALYEKSPGDMKRFRMSAARGCQDSEYRRRSIRKIRVRRVREGVSNGRSRDILKAARSVARLLGQGKELPANKRKRVRAQRRNS